ncbi:MAG TPA: glycoside hydrolase family 3 N-terminal domain-containing protein, partial [Longimicrobiaceae bacterium]
MIARRFARLSITLLLSAAAASCRAPAGGAAAPSPSRAPALTAYDARIDSLLARMTLAEKIGQMTQVEPEFLKDTADVERYFLGSILAGGNSDPKEGNSPQAWASLYERLQRRTRNTRLRIPLLYGVDAVHGHSNVLGSVIFPHNVGLGATRDPALVQRAAEITAREMRALGHHWTFAPCVCVPQDERWGRTYEGFSEDPALVSELGAAAIRGFQGSSLAGPYSVLASAKHYLGDGGTLPGTGTYGRGGGLDQGDLRGPEAM